MLYMRIDKNKPLLFETRFYIWNNDTSPDVSHLHAFISKGYLICYFVFSFSSSKGSSGYVLSQI